MKSFATVLFVIYKMGGFKVGYKGDAVPAMAEVD
jgi:hypothetical protein